MTYINSPFNGSKVKMPSKNKMTRKTFENKPEMKENFVFDVERGDCDHNEFYTQLIHKDTEEYALIIESNKAD